VKGTGEFGGGGLREREREQENGNFPVGTLAGKERTVGGRVEVHNPKIRLYMDRLIIEGKGGGGSSI